MNQQISQTFTEFVTSWTQTKPSSTEVHPWTWW